jgi:hypothetical protein
MQLQFLKSIFFGYEGTHDFFGVEVTFEDQNSHYRFGDDYISRLAKICSNSHVFRILSLAYVHVLVHEMGHILANKIFVGSNDNPKITILTKESSGYCTGEINPTSRWQRTIVLAAGPMSDIAFSTCKLVASVALKHYLSWPVSLILGCGAIIWIIGELFYAFISALKRDNGDFGRIADHGPLHLVLASAAIVSEVALAIFLTVQFY